MNNRKILRISFTAVCLILFTACSNNAAESLREISHRRQCRANMNILCTDQANYCDYHGEWAATIEQLDESARRPQPLKCPECDESYILELTESGYVISCPGDHGSIETGNRSWTAEN